MFRNRTLVTPLLLLLAACQLQSADPPAVIPSLTLTPASVNVNAGVAPVTFTATGSNSSEMVSWSYSGPGSISPTVGPITSYTPPEGVDGVQSGSLTATLGATGVSATAPIVIYPADVTPPAEPPPVNPDPPTDPGPPSNPEPPSNPDPPSNPNPPAPSEMTGNIANVEPVTLGESGTISVNLSASTSNAPSSTTYQWTAQGANASSVTFGSATSEDTTATFSAAGSYTLRLTATSGSRSASDTVSVTVNPAPEPEQGVRGVWTGTLARNVGGGSGRSIDFTLNLNQTSSDVTGTFTVQGATYPVQGTLSGVNLTLVNTPASRFPFAFDVTIDENTMTGEFNDNGTIFSLTATRSAAP